jgi:hypothetical protein
MRVIWIKLNCHGVHKSTINLSGCGVLLWDICGTCLNSYIHKIGSCDIVCDLKVLVDMVTSNCKANRNILSLIRGIRDLKNMNRHTWREGDKSTD